MTHMCLWSEDWSERDVETKWRRKGELQKEKGKRSFRQDTKMYWFQRRSEACRKEATEIKIRINPTKKNTVSCDASGEGRADVTLKNSSPLFSNIHMRECRLADGRWESKETWENPSPFMYYVFSEVQTSVRIDIHTFILTWSYSYISNNTDSRTKPCASPVVAELAKYVNVSLARLQGTDGRHTGVEGKEKGGAWTAVTRRRLGQHPRKGL